MWLTKMWSTNIRIAKPPAGPRVLLATAYNEKLQELTPHAAQ